VPPEDRSEFDALSEDLEFLDDQLMPAFAELDRAARREQNRFRRQQVALLTGGVATSAFGALQAGLERETWPGLVVALLAAATTSISWTTRQRGSLRIYLEARVKAERLRSTYFMFLGRVGDFGDASTRNSELKRSVASIKHGREPR
jgi:hypothetical protein